MMRLSELRAGTPYHFRHFQVCGQSLKSAWTAPYHQVDDLFSRGLQCQLRHGPSLSSRSIGEPLADYAAQEIAGALGVVYAEGDAIAEAKIELGNVTLQVLFAHVVIGADQSALEQPEERFDGIGVRHKASATARTRIFALSVIHALMLGKLVAYGLI